MQLIYRGQIFNYTRAESQTTHKPRAVNWRYQVSDQTYSDTEFTPTIHSQPGAVNWRWQ